MARSVAITVHPWGTESQFLSVTDALHQVLDFVEFLQQLEDPVDRNRRISWNLTKEHTNSPPLTVHAKAFSNEANKSIDTKLKQVFHCANDVVNTVAKGRTPVGLQAGSAGALRRMLDRNVRSIGQIEIRIDDGKPISILPATAKAVSRALDQANAEAPDEGGDLSRTEFGSIEGEVCSLSKWRSRPALKVVERLSGTEVVCVLNDDLAHEMGQNHNWSEVWQGRNMTFRGAFSYRADGSILRAEVESAREIQWSDVKLESLEDIDILEGRSVQEHLRRLWGE